ncbi:MAG: hypothetical protein CML06_05335 [Pseudomonadales bacterium]|nr:hypothetical protein [Pseudomonadales bacterium]
MALALAIGSVYNLAHYQWIARVPISQSRLVTGPRAIDLTLLVGLGLHGGIKAREACMALQKLQQECH